MARPDDLGNLATGEWKLLQELVDKFEQAWERSRSPLPLIDFLPAPGPLRQKVLYELIKIDLEFRWKYGVPTLLPFYLREFPELGTTEKLSSRIILEEYRARILGGDDVDLDEYKERFPDQFKDVKKLIDSEKLQKPASKPAPASPDQTLERSTKTSGGGQSVLAYTQGLKLRDYVLLERIGEGGFGQVWKARAPGDIEVAIKILFKAISTDEAQRELQALELLKALKHPFLLQNQAFWAENEQLYIVMELATGGSLRDRLRACQTEGMAGIPAPELLQYFKDAAEALDYLHARNVLHRDVKPANILLVENHAKLADFGLARQMSAMQSSTMSSGGTPAYMAPEMWHDKVHKQSDQYCFALAYCELRLGRLPFTGNMVQLMNAHLRGTPNLDPLPQAERKVLLRALAKQPRDRFRNCAEFLQNLVNAVAMSPDGAILETLVRLPAASAKMESPKTASSGTGPAPAHEVTVKPDDPSDVTVGRDEKGPGKRRRPSTWREMQGNTETAPAPIAKPDAAKASARRSHWLLWTMLVFIACLGGAAWKVFTERENLLTATRPLVAKADFQGALERIDAAPFWIGIFKPSLRDDVRAQMILRAQTFFDADHFNELEKTTVELLRIFPDDGASKTLLEKALEKNIGELLSKEKYADVCRRLLNLPAKFPAQERFLASAKESWLAHGKKDLEEKNYEAVLRMGQEMNETFKDWPEAKDLVADASIALVGGEFDTLIGQRQFDRAGQALDQLPAEQRTRARALDAKLRLAWLHEIDIKQQAMQLGDAKKQLALARKRWLDVPTGADESKIVARLASEWIKPGLTACMEKHDIAGALDLIDKAEDLGPARPNLIQGSLDSAIKYAEHRLTLKMFGEVEALLASVEARLPEAGNPELAKKVLTAARQGIRDQDLAQAELLIAKNGDFKNGELALDKLVAFTKKHPEAPLGPAAQVKVQALRALVLSEGKNDWPGGFALYLDLVDGCKYAKLQEQTRSFVDRAQSDPAFKKLFLQNKQTFVKHELSLDLDKETRSALRLLLDIVPRGEQLKLLVEQATKEFQKKDWKACIATLTRVDPTGIEEAETKQEFLALEALAMAQGNEEQKQKAGRLLVSLLSKDDPSPSKRMLAWSALATLAKDQPLVSNDLALLETSLGKTPAPDKKGTEASFNQIVSDYLERLAKTTWPASNAEWKQRLVDCTRATEPTGWVLSCRGECLLEVTPPQLADARKFAFDPAANAGPYGQYVRGLVLDAEKQSEQAADLLASAALMLPGPKERPAKARQALIQSVHLLPRRDAESVLFQKPDMAYAWLVAADKLAPLTGEAKTELVLAAGFKSPPDRTLLRQIGPGLMDNPQALGKATYPVLLAMSEAFDRPEDRVSRFRTLGLVFDMPASQRDKIDPLEMSKLVLAPAMRVGRELVQAGDTKVAPMLAKMCSEQGRLLRDHPDLAWPFAKPREEAARCYDEAWKLDDSQVSYLVGLIYSKSQLPGADWTDLEKDAQQAATLAPKDVGAQGILGHVQLKASQREADLQVRMSKIKRAIQSLDTALANRAGKTDGLALVLLDRSQSALELGNMLVRSGSKPSELEPTFSDAEKYARDAMAPEIGNRQPWLAQEAIGNACEDLALFAKSQPAKNYAKAVDAFTESLKLQPKRFKAYMARGRVRYNWASASPQAEALKLLADAEKDLKKSIELANGAPGAIEAWYFLGNVQIMQSGDPRLIYEAFDQAVKIRERHPTEAGNDGYDYATNALIAVIYYAISEASRATDKTQAQAKAQLAEDRLEQLRKYDAKKAVDFCRDPIYLKSQALAAQTDALAAFDEALTKAGRQNVFHTGVLTEKARYLATHAPDRLDPALLQQLDDAIPNAEGKLHRFAATVWSGTAHWKYATTAKDLSSDAKKKHLKIAIENFRAGLPLGEEALKDLGGLVRLGSMKHSYPAAARDLFDLKSFHTGLAVGLIALAKEEPENAVAYQKEAAQELDRAIAAIDRVIEATPAAGKPALERDKAALQAFRQKL